ncbi:MAG: M23 family metallopeptidase [Spirochaetaceae bacterium]|jgi:murein DD-endopeptidase MepM/ murein hydrolase activator NlpD|nr:M23 family metallopeptidase [Spirochaetaceae bacterium]
MVSNYTNAVKTQHVERRRQPFSLNGKEGKSKHNSLINRQGVSVYGYNAPRIIQLNQNLEKRPEIYIEPPESPQVFDPQKQDEKQKSYYETAAEPADTVSTAAAQHTQQDETQTEYLLYIGKFLPKFFIALLAAGAVGFFAYNALLWQNSDYLIQPAADNSLRTAMFDFAANGPSAFVQDTETESDNISESALSPSVPFSWQYYAVKKGDTVSKIAAAKSLSIDAVIASNKMSNARNLREGDILRIPNMDGIPYIIAKGDTYDKISEKFGVPLNVILDANDVQSGDVTAGGQIFIPGARMPADELKQALGDIFLYPLHGRISSVFGWRKDPFTGVRTFHKGIDIVSSVGAPVKASMTGSVSMVGFSPILGKYVILSHPGKYQTMYAHLNSASVTKGAKIIQGDIIGEVGNTGYSTGPHLHFVIYKNGREINPLEQLKLQ